jgi:hypothetical protein
MCQRCDGFSEEEVERGYDLTIKVDGYVRIQVESAGQPAWAYTMGLNEQFGHPDLICVQVSADLQRQLSFTVGQMIVEDGSPDPEGLAEMDVEPVAADPVHLSGNLIAMWANRYDRLPLAGESSRSSPVPRGSARVTHRCSNAWTSPHPSCFVSRTASSVGRDAIASWPDRLAGDPRNQCRCLARNAAIEASSPVWARRPAVADS